MIDDTGVTDNPANPANLASVAAAFDTTARARALVDDLLSVPWGRTSPSIYETGRMVTLAPWLRGHGDRLRYLVSTQRQDGGWGGPGGYALVPTLSATEAMLSVLLTRNGGHGAAPERDELVAAARRGLGRLFAWLRDGPVPPLPDMPAIELIVPALVQEINEHLARPADAAPTGLGAWRGARLPLPAGMDGRPLDVVRARLAAGADVPEKLLHALEVGGWAAAGAPGLRPVGPGTIGASPAATAAWLSGERTSGAAASARWHLETIVRRYGGPVPCGLPISVFERSWVVGGLLRAGIPVTVPREVTDELAQAHRPTGTPAGPGLPADADTTSASLYALYASRSPGSRRPPDSLWAYRLPTHFCTWQGEQGFSVSVNAHVLEALGEYLAGKPDNPSRYAREVNALSALLGDRQDADGCWHDRWHASPYYATACCALALGRYGVGASAATAVRRAARWTLDTQREDGSWGLWEGTAEETAYALQIMLAIVPAGEDSYLRAVRRGYAYLLGGDLGRQGPAMWHDKDLYHPGAVVESAIIASLYLSASILFPA